MVEVRTWLALVLISFGTVAATVSCGSDEVTGGGAGGGLIMGGSGGAAGKGGAVGRGGSGGTTSTGTSSLGAPCTADLDCGDSLTCVTPDDPSVGPANGLCTFKCTNNGDCSDAAPGAACVNFGTVSYCLEGCTQGDPGTDITSKCHGRPDEACSKFTSGSGATAVSLFLCDQRCRADAECGTGLFCNHKTGACSATKPTGDPVGSACDPTATTNKCLGTCLQITADGVTPAIGQCVQLCPLGIECLYQGTAPGGICTVPLSTGAGALDLGFCEPGCACTGDCTLPGDVCQAWTSASATLQADIGSAGFCYPNATDSTELTCGAGGAGNTPGGENAGAAGN